MHSITESDAYLFFLLFFCCLDCLLSLLKLTATVLMVTMVLRLNGGLACTHFGLNIRTPASDLTETDCFIVLYGMGRQIAPFAQFVPIFIDQVVIVLIGEIHWTLHGVAALRCYFHYRLHSVWSCIQ